MKKFLKSFPLTIYSVVVVTMVLFLVLLDNDQRDDLSLIDPVFWVSILSIPLNYLNKIYIYFGTKCSLIWSIILCIVLDLFLLFLRTKILPWLISKFSHNRNDL